MSNYDTIYRLVASDPSEALEAILDQHGLYGLLTTLANVCTEKVVHLQTNWQDQSTAKVWDRAAMAIASFAERAVIRQVS